MPWGVAERVVRESDFYKLKLETVCPPPPNQPTNQNTIVISRCAERGSRLLFHP